MTLRLLTLSFIVTTPKALHSALGLRRILTLAAPVPATHAARRAATCSSSDRGLQPMPGKDMPTA